jgi:hypothetical protein
MADFCRPYAPFLMACPRGEIPRNYFSPWDMLSRLQKNKKEEGFMKNPKVRSAIEITSFVLFAFYMLGIVVGFERIIDMLEGDYGIHNQIQALQILILTACLLAGGIVSVKTKNNEKRNSLVALSCIYGAGAISALFIGVLTLVCLAFSIYFVFCAVNFKEATAYMKKCSHCNHDVSSNDSYCPSCGGKCTSDVKYCVKCGNRCTSDAMYCASCGNKC